MLSFHNTTVHGVSAARQRVLIHIFHMKMYIRSIRFVKGTEHHPGKCQARAGRRFGNMYTRLENRVVRDLQRRSVHIVVRFFFCGSFSKNDADKQESRAFYPLFAPFFWEGGSITC